MFGTLRSAYRVLRLHALRRRQHDSLKLRGHFLRHHNIDVGLYSYGCFDHWRMPGPLRVGRYCSIARTVRSTNNNHPTDALTTHPALYDESYGVIDRNHVWDGYLHIEDDVWIGHNVVILPGCRTIGRGSIIGAGAIVTRDVARYAVMAGNPARKLRDRFPPETAMAIEASRWWEMSLQELRQAIKTNPDMVYKPTPAAMARISAVCPGTTPFPVGLSPSRGNSKAF